MGVPRRKTRRVRTLLGISPVKDKEGEERSKQEESSDHNAGQTPVKGEREKKGWEGRVLYSCEDLKRFQPGHWFP